MHFHENTVVYGNILIDKKTSEVLDHEFDYSGEL